ncbi:hypothetical protein JAAARDRAFT_548991 [Jaapia argillacea MUCL 33604]|uniref:F-box domain-containing protein n=1 Tax=Jaapia argillacea MUCL 33604 TaxID=933084 RepID=A0A067P714_9AGAM|nr:hypothetical protein JAAARDRAFT_548991 [Jaapia argillacea MUCL 33604]
MAQVLSIREICFEICLQLKSSPAHPVLHPGPWMGDLLHLALCSRSIAEEAMRVLWMVIHDAEPLLRLLPGLESTSVVVGGDQDWLPPFEMKTYRVIRPLQKDDWTRFDAYSRYIRHFHLQSVSSLAVDPDIFRILSHYELTPLFPSLVNPDWSNEFRRQAAPIREIIPQIMPFLGPLLRKLTVGVHASSWNESHDDLTAFLHMIPQRCPSLETFGFSGFSHHPLISLSFLGQFQKLQRLCLGSDDGGWSPPMDAALLCSLSKLPKLLELSHITVFGADNMPSLIKPGFPSLKTLTIDSGDLRGVELVLKMLSPTLQHCSVGSAHGGTYNEYLACLGHISSKGEFLESFEFGCIIAPIPPPTEEAVSSIVQAIFTLKLPRVRALELSQGWEEDCVGIISPSDVEQCSLIWPQFKSFIMTTSFASFTLHSLSTFASQCRSLKRLVLDVLDVTATDATALPHGIPVLSHGLQYLSIFSLEGVIHPAPLAGMLDRMFPHVYANSSIVNDDVGLLISTLQTARRDQEQRMKLTSLAGC